MGSWIWLYLGIINVAGFAVMGADKRRARRGSWRIPERTLFAVALAGGSLGVLLGMRLFHHKTRHWYFVVGVPLILAVQVILAVALCRML
ncbi:MAG: DUF1294 domain-containing protein [Clostridiales bacterium]|nr:DUF1294 domain-containing protein [Clostridiales bacterium]